MKLLIIKVRRNLLLVFVICVYNSVHSVRSSFRVCVWMMAETKKTKSAKEKLSPRVRRWCITVNNFNQETIDNIRKVLDDDIVYYAVVGRETAPSTGTTFAVLCSFSRVIGMRIVKKMFSNSAHCEAARAGDLHNSEYCRKDNDILLEVPDQRSR